MLDYEQKTDTGVLLANNPAIPDGVKQGFRLFRYGELGSMPIFQPKVSQAIEGSYFTANNGQTGLATAAAPTAFSATNPFLILFNKDSVKSLVMDYAALVATAAGTAGASVQAAVVIDSGNRFSSGGSPLTPVNPNGQIGAGSIVQANAGNLTASAPTSQARTLVGQRALKGAIPVAGDSYFLKFGADDMLSQVSTATLSFSSQAAPAIIVPPQWSLLLHIWLPSQSAASSFIPEAGWSERVC